jgi:hypothetical protein
MTVRSAELCGFLELLEPNRQPITIGTVLIPPRPADHLTDDPFEPEFEKRGIMGFEQPIRDVDAEIGVDADQIGTEGRMVDFGEPQAIGDDRLS